MDVVRGYLDEVVENSIREREEGKVDDSKLEMNGSEDDETFLEHLVKITSGTFTHQRYVLTELPHIFTSFR